MQAHRDEFTQFIWKRRVQTKKDLRALFQSGPGIIGRFGDLIADSSLDAIQSFEKSNSNRICKDAISFGFCEQEDIQGYYRQVVQLMSSIPRKDLKFHGNRLEFHVTAVDEMYHCCYATSGPWAVKLYSKSLVRSLVEETMNSLKAIAGRETEYSYVPILARLVDMIHPTHQLQAAVLAYPLFGAQILKRRVVALGYEMGNMNEENAPVDYKYCLELVRLLQRKQEQEMRTYFEFTTPGKAEWIVGFCSANKVSATSTVGYPGNDAFSLGFTSAGNVIADALEMKYWDDRGESVNTRCVGILVDLYHGAIHIVIDNIVQPPGFGRGATMWSAAEQERQRTFITKQHILPMFAIKGTSNESALHKPRMQVNFGTRNFHHFVNATPLNSLHIHISTKGIDSISILESGNNRDRISQEEDEKVNLALEKNYFRVSLLPEVAKSFSQFPPSVYRRSLAATRIQRAWRRFQGKKMREQIKKEQYRAACIIQRMARRKLRKIREIKNNAAFKIQKAWRRKCHIWVALLRCIYRQPISTLHNAAMTIQRKWRNWHMFKNSPLASKYHRRIEGKKCLTRLGKGSQYNYTLVETSLRTVTGNSSETHQDTSDYQSPSPLQRISTSIQTSSRYSQQIAYTWKYFIAKQKISSIPYCGLHNPKSVEKLCQKTHQNTKGQDQAHGSYENSSCVERVLGAIT
jgi:hypothetical protein